MYRKVHKTESGTCNVCSAPCSSCMHLNMAQMGSKSEEFSDETCHVTVASQHSANEGKACDNLQNTLSEASNLLSINSSHDSFSENVESEATVRPPDASDASEVVETQKNSSNKYEGSRDVEGNDDTISCLSRASDAVKDVNKDLNRVDAGSHSSKLRSRQSHHSQIDKYPVGGSSEVLNKIHPKFESETDNHCGDRPEKVLAFSNKDEQDNLNELVDLIDKQEPTVHEASGDESDESDVVEHDVKVCDICGDAGREDLLAICSKCSDGAEHTYCMREMLQKVPEGDWLCEECKLAEEAESLKQGSDVEGKRVDKPGSSRQNSGKRLAENLEGAPAAKRQTIETNIGSPKSSSPSRVAALSRESSFKSIDKGKMRPSSHMFLGNHSNNDMSEATRSPTSGSKLQESKGTFSKSTSFSSKPKVRPVDRIFHQKPKHAGEHSSNDTKDDPVRVLRKSLSFKSAIPGGSLNAGESKVKMLSPRHSHVQDAKGFKQLKDRISLERKNISKLDRSSSTVSTPKVDQKLTSRAETISHSSVSSNNRESKVGQTDGKLSTFPRSTSSLGRKGVDIAVASAVGGSASSSNGVPSSAEQKINQVSLKDEPSNNSNGVLQEGLPRLPDSINQDDKMRENSVNLSLKGVPCQKCKESGHTTESCSLGTPEAAAVDISAPGNSREVINKGNKLKAAIEAAIRMKPGICERASKDQLSVSTKAKSMIAVESTQGGWNQATNTNMKQVTAQPTDAVSVVPSVGNSATRDWPSHALTLISGISNMSAIPEHKYMWQGGFEVHRGGRLPDFCGGIQAHLSSLASPKVLEVVNRFPLNVTLNEVPRLSTWPTQFHKSGPKEDNIALYFFAKDLESYEKNYRSLLDSMVKNDLALKGSFDGVELLIFPSNHLPDNCQRWNSLLFLWGVFKGRRVDCSSTPSSSIALLDKDITSDLPQNMHSLKPLDNGSATKGSACLAVRSTNTSEKMFVIADGIYDNQVEQNSLGTKGNSVKQDIVFDSKPLTRIEGSGIQEEHSLRGHGLETEVRLSSQATETSSGSIKGEKVQMHVREDASTSENTPEVGVLGSVIKGINGDQVKGQNSIEDYGCTNRTTVSDRNLNLLQSNHRKRPYLDLSEVATESSNDTSRKIARTEVKNVFVEGDSRKPNRGLGGIYDCSSSRDQNSSSGGFASQVNDLGSCSSIEDKRCDNNACEEKVITEDLGTSERFFFPSFSHHEEDFGSWRNHMPGKSSEDVDRVRNGVPNLELALGADVRPPNKGSLPFFVGMVDKNNNHDKPQDKVTDKPEEDDVSASLSLSLSFPFPDGEQTVKPVSKTEQLLPDSHPVNTSLLLFRSFQEK
ncbi:hypothetical protein SLEP1_g19208 [Rubroshorea leprosula]|nr:hypothetical protein SLEP1_g19208 [Rubroshorea leprosula]